MEAALGEQILIQSRQLRRAIGVLGQGGLNLTGHALDLPAIRLDVQLVVVEFRHQQGGVDHIDVLFLALQGFDQLGLDAFGMNSLGELAELASLLFQKLGAVAQNTHAQVGIRQQRLH